MFSSQFGWDDFQVSASYDGTTWDWDMNIPGDLYGNFNSIFGFGSDDIYAVGTHGQIMH